MRRVCGLCKGTAEGVNELHTLHAVELEPEVLEKEDGLPSLSLLNFGLGASVFQLTVPAIFYCSYLRLHLQSRGLPSLPGTP